MHIVAYLQTHSANTHTHTHTYTDTDTNTDTDTDTYKDTDADTHTDLSAQMRERMHDARIPIHFLDLCRTHIHVICHPRQLRLSVVLKCGFAFDAFGNLHACMYACM
jgi:hypothetical protein